MIFTAIAVLWAVLLATRLFLALRYAKGYSTAVATSSDVTVVQPILSGDPRLETCLRANATANPEAHFLWMVDHSDAEGVRIAQELSAEIDPERILTIPGHDPVDGENPKTAKLIRALPLVQTRVILVLDDDTVIDADGMSRLAGALKSAALVTGLPAFVSTSTVWERFLGGFVNGNAILTYLPSAAVGAQRTINGMIYATDADVLRGLGGFAAIQGELTDDYALARLYQRNGLSLLQTPVCVRVHVTVRDAAHCARVLRRWMIFANRYFRENNGGKTIFLGALPGLLPPLGLLAAAFAGWRACAVWIAVLALGSCCNRILLWRIAQLHAGPTGIAFEVLAALLLPIFWISALIRPHSLTWRNRRLDTAGGRIRYR
jgi:ceramide glucosyltransferase